MPLYFIFNFITVFSSIFYLYKLIHIYQLKDYNNTRYFKHFLKIKTLIFPLLFSTYFLMLSLDNFYANAIGFSLFFILTILYFKTLIISKKTPLKLTNKVKRLFSISILLLLSLTLLKNSFLLIYATLILLPPISNFLNIYDKIKNKIFIRKAQKKLLNTKAKIIAITGSNGKTSVKNFLNEMLSKKYKVQATPASFNTPLGIAKFINNELKYDCDFLILEYGARRKNDIKKLCNFYGADYGIITTISPQHLQTFHTIENIYQAKKKLADFLQEKMCVFNTDNLYTLRMFENKTGNKLSVGINPKANIGANNIFISNNKTCFTLHINNTKLDIETNLLGKHNVLNISLAAALAHHLNISLEEIKKSIENLKPVEHRLSLIKSHINILDDSYNCSLSSAKEALWVLNQFPNKKMVVTPGIIECGKQKHLLNFKLGIMISSCDYCIIVGNENKKALYEGIMKAEPTEKYSPPEVIFTKSLEDSKQYFTKLKSNDSLLILNDLPDDYS